MESMEARKERAVAKIEKTHLLLDVYKKERKNIDRIIDQAINFPAGANRWPAYSDLKKQASLLVGWYATRDEFSASSYYETMIDFIDYVLPQAQDEDEYSDYPQISRAPDLTEIEAWHSRADYVLQVMKQDQLLLKPKSERRQEMESIYDGMFKTFGDEDER